MTPFKTKDQVRGLYYRIWSTVSKYVQSSCFPEKLTDKSGQELYAMMAYGELRRKLKVEPSNHRKILELKFGELVKTQQTCVKFKGQLKALKPTTVKAYNFKVKLTRSLVETFMFR